MCALIGVDIVSILLVVDDCSQSITPLFTVQIGPHSVLVSSELVADMKKACVPFVRFPPSPFATCVFALFSFAQWRCHKYVGGQRRSGKTALAGVYYVL